jgi:ribosomal protein L7/L12
MDKQKLPEDALAALESGRKIAAIKSVRIHFNVGLKEAKEIVEEYIEADPQLKQRISVTNNNAAQSAFSGLLVIAVIVLLIYYFMK